MEDQTQPSLPLPEPSCAGHGNGRTRGRRIHRPPGSVSWQVTVNVPPRVKELVELAAAARGEFPGGLAAKLLIAVAQEDLWRAVLDD